MKIATRYVADDGSEWTSETQAQERDGLIAEVADIMGALPSPPDGALDGGRAYLQHSPADVLAAQSALARAYLKRWPDCNGHIQWVLHADRPAGDTFFGRILSDSGKAAPINAAWYRIMRIDDQYREWEQPYFTRHPPANAARITV